MDLSQLRLSETEARRFEELHARYQNAALNVHTARRALDDATAQMGRMWRAIPRADMDGVGNWSTSNVGEVAALMEELSKAHGLMKDALAEQASVLLLVNEMMGNLKARLPRATP